MKTTSLITIFSFYLKLTLACVISMSTIQATEISNPVSFGDIETTTSPKNDWLGLNYFPEDPDDTPSSDLERINWKVATMADDDFNLYIYFENHNLNISPTRFNGSNLGFSWGWQVFLDTDNSADTGFQLSNVLGADYIIEGNVLMKYEGDGTNWNWATIGPLASNYNGRKVEYTISRISIDNPKSVKAVLQGSNESHGGDTTDIYPDGAYDQSATTRYLNYKLTDSTVIGENNPPILNDQTFVIPKNNPQRGFNINGSDEDNHYLTYTILTSPENGSFYFKRFGGTFYVIFYSPNQGFIGEDTLTYKATDSIDETRVATITFNVVEDNSQDSYSNSIEDEAIFIDADLSDWSTVLPFPDRSLTNTSNPINGANWLNASIAHSQNNLYFSYINRNQIVPDELSGTYIPWGYQAFIDTDQDKSTGFLLNEGIGADYMVEGNYLYFYNGDGYNWDWQELSALEASFDKSFAEIKVPRNLINFSQSAFNIYFVGNNAALNNTLPITYPVTSNRFFKYKIGAGTTATEINVSNNQQGLAQSPISHRTELPYSNSNQDSSSGGGVFNYWTLMLFTLLIVFRCKVRRSLYNI